MNCYQYRAWLNSSMTKGQILANSEQHAIELLVDRGLMPESIVPYSTRLTRELPITVQSGIVGQLAMLLKAGVPLLSALSSMIDQSRKGNVSVVLSEIKGHLEHGAPLGDAIAATNKFDALVGATVSASEQSGKLDNSLQQLSNYLETRARLSQSLKKALAYPLFILLVTIIITAFLMSTVVPQLSEMYSSQGAALPKLTQNLIAFSNLISQYPLQLGIGASVFLCCLWGVFRFPSVAEQRDRLVIKLPLVGGMLSSYIASTWLSTLYHCVAAGVPLNRSLRLSQSVVTNRAWHAPLEQIEADVDVGVGIQLGVDALPRFSPICRDLVLAGFASGEFAESLLKSADFEQHRYENSLDTVLKLVPTFTLLIMGGVVLGIVSAILLPIFELNQIVG